MLTAKQATERLSCSFTNTYALIQSDRLPASCVGATGKGYRISEEDLTNFLKEGKKGRRIAAWPEKAKPIQLKHLR